MLTLLLKAEMAELKRTYLDSGILQSEYFEINGKKKEYLTAITVMDNYL